jgi:Fe2+ or Zn2+ uptake regulation protein
MSGHRTAEEVGAWLGAHGHRVARSTVFKGLEEMARAQVVMRADPGAGPARYELARDWHHHFVCRTCGVVVDVPCVRGETPCLDPLLPAPAMVDEAQVTFRGYCPACSAGSP